MYSHKKKHTSSKSNLTKFGLSPSHTYAFIQDEHRSNNYTSSATNPSEEIKDDPKKVKK